jgi:hypothetical protein
MECDSMHAAIEGIKKVIDVQVPSQWDNVIRMARRGNPYHVVPLHYSSCFDLKKLAKETCSNMKIDTNGNRMNWLAIKHQ